MIKQLAHVCIHSTDIDATEAFYCDALGLTKSFEFVREGERIGFYLEFGNRTFIEVFRGDPGKVGNINHLALEVDDMDAVLARVTDAGFTATEKKLGADESWQTWLEDPGGTRIELHEYTEQSRQLRGGRCEVNW